MAKMFQLASLWNLPLQRKGLYSPLEADMKELPHPSRNLTVSRVVIMVRMFFLIVSVVEDIGIGVQLENCTCRECNVQDMALWLKMITCTLVENDHLKLCSGRLLVGIT